MENGTMFVEIKEGEKILMSHEISRFNTQQNTLSVCFRSVQMFDIPMAFDGMYTVKIILPEQVITKICLFSSYNYIVFSNTFTKVDGSKVTSLDCSDNSLLFRVIG